MILANFQEPHISTSDEFRLLSTPIIVEGAYWDMIQLAYHLEHTKKTGRLAHANFVLEKDRKRNKDVLKATLLVQNVQDIKEGK